jgi:two-component system NtrC family sensor kinase
MAHELNNILAGMVAYADYALEEGDSDKIREALKMSISAAEKASELGQKFLTVAGPLESQRQDVDLHLEVGRLLESMEPRFKKDNIRLHRQLEGVPRVHADPVQILQALRHLLDNAAEAIRKDGTISVKTETDWDRGNVRVVVTDSGPGIPVEYLDRVFDPFFTTKGVVSGGGSTGAKGLGLSVAKGIVEAHGGKIYAGNVLPHGASIVVELPLAGGAAEKPPSPSIY